MKTNRERHAWSVRSVTDHDGRRVITLLRTPNLSEGESQRTGIPTLNHKSGSKLQAEFAPEELSAFQPLIRAPRPARRRLTCQPALQLLNA